MVTVVFALVTGLMVADTVAVPPLSVIELSSSDRVTVGTDSSSVMVPVPVIGVVVSPPVKVALVGLLSWMTTVSSASYRVSPVIETSILSLSRVALSVSVPLLTAV